MTESSITGIGDGCDYNDIVSKWNDVHKYSPAPRHRRRIMMKMIRELDFADCLDIGCAQPFLLQEILREKKARIAGCDISENVILSNRRLFPQADFFVMDISKPRQHDKQYDLVTCSEVLEHVEDWRTAVRNISSLCRTWLIITVPSGRVYPIDKHVGHIRHYQGGELLKEFEESGFKSIDVCRWGFPFHSIYKYTINMVFRDKLYKSFAEEKYGFGKKIISNCIYSLFFCNDLFKHGSQLIVLMGKKDVNDV
jgi:hypothetical protein